MWPDSKSPEYTIYPRELVGSQDMLGTFSSVWPVLRPYQDDILLASVYDKARVRLQGFGPCLYLVYRIPKNCHGLGVPSYSSCRS